MIAVDIADEARMLGRALTAFSTTLGVAAICSILFLFSPSWPLAVASIVVNTGLALLFKLAALAALTLGGSR